VPEPTPAAPAAENGGKENGGKGNGYTFTLGAVTNCVTPFTHGDAKTEEGKIDVTTENNVLKVVMTGGVGANVFLGFESIATQTFQLVQEFEVTSSDPNVREVILTLDSGLVGFVRAKHKASACAYVASVSVAPVGWSTTPLVANHPQLCVAGPNTCGCGGVGLINKDPLPQITSQPMPLGRYVVQATFMIQATAQGILDGHSAAIFSPEPKELDPWEREHDIYKGEEKEGYGFTSIITATPVNGKPVANAWKKYHKAPKVAKRTGDQPTVR
jgi:hypothetical protein